jgi:hypothetical protein
MMIVYIVGTVFFSFGFVMLLEAQLFRRSAERFPGKVIGYETGRSDKGQTMYYPIVRFATPDGYDIVFKEGIGTSPMPYGIDAEVDVLVYKRMFSTARIKGSGRRLIGAIMLLMGGIALAVAIGSAVEPGLKVSGALVVTAITLAGSWAALVYIARSRQSDEREYDYTLHEDGTIGYVPSASAILEAAAAQRHRYSKRWHLVGMVLGIALLVGGGYWAKVQQRFLHDALRVEGTIVSQQVDHDSDGTTYRPIIEFIPRGSERSLRFTSSMGSSHPGWRVGDRTGVYYAPGNPRDAMEDNGLLLNYLPQAILIAIGLFMALFSVRAYIRKK